MAERARATNGDATKDDIERAAKGRRKAEKAKAAKPAKNAGPVSDETVQMHVNLIREAKENWQKARDVATQAQSVLRNRRKVAAELVAKLRDIRCFEVNVATAKKVLTGNGRAEKADMVIEATRRGFDVTDDHQADACAVGLVALAAMRARAA